MKYRASSSFESVGVWSWHAEFTGASRCTGSDHSDHADVIKEGPWRPTLGWAGCVSQARSRASGASEASLCNVVVIEPPMSEVERPSTRKHEAHRSRSDHPKS